jgi:histidinol-phosphatase (PHP family)
VLADYHMHLVGDDDPHTDESHGLAHIRGYVQAAAAAGVAEIGFTEHVYRYTVARDWMSAEGWRESAVGDIDRYVEAVAGAAAAGLPVRLGLELDWVPGRGVEIAALAAAYDWDYLLGSYHWLGDREVDHAANSVWETLPAHEVWRRYVDGFCQAARSGLYDSMSHPDLAKVFGHRPDPEPLDLYAEMAQAAAEGGVCIEVSTAGYRRALGELYPAPRLLAMFREHGVPATMGSDAHAPAGVGRDFPRAVSELRAAGYDSITLFERRRRRQVALP